MVSMHFHSIIASLLVVCALLAPTERGAAIKFALGSLSGCALFFAVADLVREALGPAPAAALVA